MLKVNRRWRAECVMGTKSMFVLALGLWLGFAPAAGALDIKAGAIGLVKPTYEGSDRYEVIGVPFAYPVFGGANDGTFAINGADDVRLRLFSASGFEAGILGGYSFGRDQDDGPLLAGLGDVDGGLIAGAYVGYRFAGALIDVSYHHIVSGDDTGGYLRIGLSGEQRLSSSLTVSARAGATYADDNYMTSYFAVSAAQAASSAAGLPVFDAGSGFKDVHIQLGASYDIDERWTLLAGAGYKRLIGDAADSPVIETADQFSARFGFTYRFSFQR